MNYNFMEALLNIDGNQMMILETEKMVTFVIKSKRKAVRASSGSIRTYVDGNSAYLEFGLDFSINENFLATFDLNNADDLGAIKKLSLQNKLYINLYTDSGELRCIASTKNMIQEFLVEVMEGVEKGEYKS